MTQYVALLRGIGPADPRMRNENLRGVCEELGFSKVETVISSGNIIFETGGIDAPLLESMLEEAWPARLGFESTTIIRERAELERLVASQPFGDRLHSENNYLLVTFSKHPLEVPVNLPFQPPDRDWQLIGATDRELFTVADNTSRRPVDNMRWIEKQFGRQISSRTWLTVGRILKKMG